MPQEPDDREYTPDESRLKTSFRECIPLFIALGDSTRLAIIQQLYEVEEDADPWRRSRKAAAAYPKNAALRVST